MNIFTSHRSHSGFTLLEMLFAVVIFSFALISIMTIASRGVIATSTAKNQLIAQYLGEELLEVARNVRDTNFDNAAPWYNGLIQCSSPNVCDIQYGSPGMNPVLEVCQDGECGNLFLTSFGEYLPDASGGITSQFSRELTVERIPGTDNEYRLDATVYWQEKNIPRSRTISTYIANWQ